MKFDYLRIYQKSGLRYSIVNALVASGILPKSFVAAFDKRLRLPFVTDVYDKVDLAVQRFAYAMFESKIRTVRQYGDTPRFVIGAQLVLESTCAETQTNYYDIKFDTVEDTCADLDYQIRELEVRTEIEQRVSAHFAHLPFRAEREWGLHIVMNMLHRYGLQYVDSWVCISGPTPHSVDVRDFVADHELQGLLVHHRLKEYRTKDGCEKKFYRVAVAYKHEAILRGTSC